MGILRDIRCLFKHGFDIVNLQGDNIDNRPINRFVIFDTGLYADNLGDCIINYYCQKVFEKLNLNIIHRIPTQHKVSDEDNVFLKNEIGTGKIITGTNVLCKHVFDSKQWQKPVIDKRLSHLILMGVGIDNYKKTMDRFTKKFYQIFLDRYHLHSVRDSETEKLVKSLGFENVVNTACPTMWNLTPDFCRKINKYKTDDVITTVTEYNKNPLDFEILDLLLKNYRNVYLWLQSEYDLPYIQTYPQYTKLKLISSSLDAYNKILENDNLEYIGSRLHGGIHALNKGKRTLIIAVDERGETIGCDTGLPVISRSNSMDVLEKFIANPRETTIVLPEDNIRKWKQSLTIEGYESV